MLADNLKHKEDRQRVERLEHLVSQYVQSRSLGLWIGAIVVVINTVVLMGSIEAAKVLLVYGVDSWWLVPLALAGLWVLISTVWLIKLEKKCGHSFYDKREGRIEVEREKIPTWAWGAYMTTFLGPLILNMCNILSTRWSLAMSLMSFGIFIFYLSKKQKEKLLGVVFSVLCLVEAAATAIGVPPPLGDNWVYIDDKSWVHTCYLSLITYIVIAGLVAAMGIHIYNRRILRKIKEMRFLGEQQTDKSDS